MGLGDFADSSTGSGTSSKSRGAEANAKEGVENLPQTEQVTVDEGINRKSSTQEEKMDEGLAKLSSPQISSTSSTLETKKRSVEAACDAAVDGMENDEDQDFSLPIGSTNSQLMAGKRPRSVVEANPPRRKSLRRRTRTKAAEEAAAAAAAEEEEEEEQMMTQERESSSESSTSHSSQELTPDSRQGLSLSHLHVHSFVVRLLQSELFLFWPVY